MFNKLTIDIISRKFCLSGIIQTYEGSKKKNDEALHLARLGEGITKPPRF